MYNLEKKKYVSKWLEKRGVFQFLCFFRIFEPKILVDKEKIVCGKVCNNELENFVFSPKNKSGTHIFA
jgi:hypothetical protein